MISKKNREYLRKISHDIPDIVFIGKNGITDEVIKQVEDNLKARELIKCKVLQNSDVVPYDAADLLAEKTNSDVIKVIGKKFVLYKKNENKKDNIIPSKKEIKRQRSLRKKRK